MNVTPHRPFRFGVQLSGQADGPSWRELGRKLEDLGYATATMPDHFTEQFAPVPALQALADATTSLRIGALVFDNDYRHPLVLAKEMATMDLLSGGRVEIGLGAGWMESDYRASGIAYDAPRRRIDRFEEAITVLKRSMADEPFSFTGNHYTITDYHGRPTPLQRPHPPLLIGGGGPRLLSIAAREADIVGVNGTLTAGVVGAEALGTMRREVVEERLAVVRDAAGERFADIELNIRVFFIAVTEDPRSVVEGIASSFGVDPRDVEASPFALIGPVSAIAEELVRARDELGFSYVVVGQDDVDPLAPVVAALAGT